jgi:hypothetical protein
VNSLGRPVRLLMTCLVAAGLSTGDMCLCGSSTAACHSTTTQGATPPATSCCCGRNTGGRCRCHMACCQKQTPDQSGPAQSNQDTRSGTSGWVKAFVQSVMVLTGAEGTARWSANSPYELASPAAPATLQLRHMRLQI